MDDTTTRRETDSRPRQESKWHKDASGNIVMPQLQSDYLDWLLDDNRFPDTEAEWCQLNGIERGTVKRWRSDRRFREQHERRATEKQLSPERLQRVIDVLYQSAVGTGDVAAAKQYLLYTEKLAPTKQLKRDASVSHMTDAELRAEVEGILAAGFGRETPTETSP